MKLVSDQAGAPVSGVLEEVFRDRYAALVGVARFLVDERADAEEVVQEAFARTYARAPGLQTTAEASAYVQRAVVNLCRDTLRHRRIARRVPLVEAGRAPGADREVLLDDDQRRVTAAVRALPRRQRECVVLRYLLECSTAETARALGIAEGTVKSNLSRGLSALGDELEGSR